MRFLAKRYILITFSAAAIVACFCAMALVWALEAKTISRLEAAFVKADLGWVEIWSQGELAVALFLHLLLLCICICICTSAASVLCICISSCVLLHLLPVASCAFLVSAWSHAPPAN